MLVNWTMDSIPMKMGKEELQVATATPTLTLLTLTTTAGLPFMAVLSHGVVGTMNKITKFFLELLRCLFMNMN